LGRGESKTVDGCADFVGLRLARKFSGTISTRPHRFAARLAKASLRDHYCGRHGHPKMKPSLTDTLCTRCGLCCDGTLFADVELAGTDEAVALEIMGLEIEEEEESGLLLQPCAALKGKRCSIYPHRPDCCRTFECRLLQRVQRGALGVERANGRITEALKRIERIKELIVQLGPGVERLPLKERSVEALALAEAGGADPAMKRKRAELQAAMRSVERLIRETFLGKTTQRNHQRRCPRGPK
jgi:Fe-S-cluster containining protein